MTASLQELKQVAASLPHAERADLAQFLLRSLDGDEEDAGARAEWLALAEARMAEVRRGDVVSIPADEVLRSLPGPPR